MALHAWQELSDMVFRSGVLVGLAAALLSAQALASVRVCSVYGCRTSVGSERQVQHRFHRHSHLGVNVFRGGSFNRLGRLAWPHYAVAGVYLIQGGVSTQARRDHGHTGPLEVVRMIYGPDSLPVQRVIEVTPGLHLDGGAGHFPHD